MFTRYHGEEAVKAGTYLGVKSGEFVNVERDGEGLPGQQQATYVKVSPIVALLIGPLAGLVFVIFLPLAVPALMLWLIAGRLWAATPALAHRLTLSSRPVAAYAGEGANVTAQRTGQAEGIDAVMDEMAKRLDAGDGTRR